MTTDNLNLDYITGIKEATEITPLDQLKLAIIGAQKNGKSRLAATGRKPIFFADFDGRAASVSGLQDVHVKTYQDPNPIDGKAFADFQKDLGMIEYHKLNGDPIPKTIVLDSMTYFIQAALRYVMSQSNAGVKTFNIGGFRMNVARGYDPYGGETNYTVNTIERIIALGCDIICVFHERPEETADSTQENPKFTGKVTVHPPRAAGYLALFNELWRVTESNGVYQVQTKPNYDFTASTCFEGIETMEKPDIEYLIGKHMMAFQQNHPNK